MKTAPTIGRVVLYWPDANDGGSNNHQGNGHESAQPMAATVAYVWDDNMVNLAIVDHTGYPFSRMSVPFTEEDQTALPGSCEWMPYQKEQAAKI